MKMARSSRMMALSLLACVVLGNFVWNLVLPYSLYNATNLITVIGWSLGLIVSRIPMLYSGNVLQNRRDLWFCANPRMQI